MNDRRERAPLPQSAAAASGGTPRPPRDPLSSLGGDNQSVAALAAAFRCPYP